MTNSPKTWSEARAAARRHANSITKEEDARIARGIEADPDARELTDKDFARMKPARGGRPPKPAEERKKSVTLRLSPDVLDTYKASGPGWQTRIDETLRRAAPRVASLAVPKVGASSTLSARASKSMSPSSGRKAASKRLSGKAPKTR